MTAEERVQASSMWVPLAMQPSFACGVLLHEIAFDSHPIGRYPAGPGATTMFKLAERYLRSRKRNRPFNNNNTSNSGSAAAASPTIDGDIIGAIGEGRGTSGASHQKRTPLSRPRAFLRAGIAIGKSVLNALKGSASSRSSSSPHGHTSNASDPHYSRIASSDSANSSTTTARANDLTTANANAPSSTNTNTTATNFAPKLSHRSVASLTVVCNSQNHRKS